MCLLCSPMKKNSASFRELPARRVRRFAALGTSVLALSALTVKAVTWFWDSTTNSWSSSVDWIAPGPAGPPASAIDTILSFDGSGSTAYTSTDDIAGPFLLNGLTLNSTATVTETISGTAGNPLTFSANGGTNPTISASGSGSFAIGNDLALAAPTTLTGTGNGTVTLNGVVSGTGANSMIVSSGHYILTNANNSFNGVTVTGGILEVNAGAGAINLFSTGTNTYLGTGTITINGGELRLTTTGNSAATVIGSSAAGSLARTVTFGTAGGVLNINGMDNTAGFNISLANTNAALSIIRFAGGAQGLNGGFPSGATTWADDANALRLQTVTGQTANTPLQIELTNGAELALENGLSGTINAPLTLSGVPNGDPTAGGGEKTTGRVVLLAGPYTFTNGLFLSNTLQFEVGNGPRTLNGNITFNPGANVGFQGRGTGTAIGSPETNALQFGTAATINASTLTISNGATAAMDLHLRTDATTAHGIQLYDQTNILAGGTLKFTQSFANGNNVGWVDAQGDITGNGTTAADSVIDLRIGAANTTTFSNTNGVTFNNPGSTGVDLIVNGTGFGGLKVIANTASIRTSTSTGSSATFLTDPVLNENKLSNLLTDVRLAALTGTGGYLTTAASGRTWAFPAGGEWSNAVPVGLKVINSNPGATSVSLAALSSFVHNVAIDGGAIIDTGSSNFIFGPATATTGLGLLTGTGTINGSGGITINTGATIAPGLAGIGSLTVGNITLNGTLEIETTNAPASDLLTSTGTLALGGASTLTLPGTNTYNGLDYTIATFASMSGAFASVFGLPNTYALVYGTNSITLHPLSLPTKVWTGSVNGLWDVAGTTNWQGPAVFNNGDIANFDGTDNGSHDVITVSGGDVSPIKINVDTSVHNYTLISSAGAAIAGTGALTKTGSGTLTLSGPATYTGGTSVKGGTLALGSDNAIPATGSVSIDAGATLDTQNHNNVLADLTVNGSALGTTSTLTVNSLTLGSSAVFEPNLILHGPLTANAPIALSLNSNIDLGAATRTVTATPGTSPELTLNGVISNGGLSKAGNGTLVLANGANSYSGGTTVNAGTLLMGVAGAIPTNSAVTINGGTLDTNGMPFTVSLLSGTGGTLNLSGAALTVSQTSTTSYAGGITGAGTSLTKELNGTLALGGTSSFSGGLTINGGTVIAAAIGSVGTGGVTVNAGTTFQVGAALTNTITLAGGRLASQSNPAQVTNTSLTVSANSTILLADSTNLGNASEVILTGTLQGSGNLNVIVGVPGVSPDAGTTPGFRLRGAGTSNYTGTITVNQSTKLELQASTPGPFSPAGSGNIVMAGGTFTTGTLNGTYSVLNMRNVTPTNPTTGVGNTILGNNISVSGTGFAMINLPGTAAGPSTSFPLGSTSQFGTLTLGNNQGLGIYRSAGNTQAVQFNAVSLTGGTVTLGADPVGFAAAGTGNLILGSITESAASNVISSIGGATPATIVLSGSNAYSGTTTLLSGSTGTLAASAAGALPAGTALTVDSGTVDLNFNGTSNDQTVAVLSGAGGKITNTDGFNTRTFTVNQSSAAGPTTFAGGLEGNLNFTKSGNGTLILSSFNVNHVGQTLVTGGTLQVNGSVLFSPVTVASGSLGGTGTISSTVTIGDGVSGFASIDPADNATAGTLNTGALSLAFSNSNYVMELDSTHGTTDLLNVTGELTLGAGVATLSPSDLDLAPLSSPGTQFIIAQTTDGVSGFFAGLPEGQQFAIGANQYTISYAGGGGDQITLTSVPEPGTLLTLSATLGTWLGLRRFRRVARIA